MTQQGVPDLRGTGQELRVAYLPVRALTDTDSAFIVAGKIGQAGGTQHAVTWILPDHNSSIWRDVPSVSRGVPGITALSAAGGLPTGAAQQGPTAHVITFSA
jgi:hypothetical protein